MTWQRYELFSKLPPSSAHYYMLKIRAKKDVPHNEAHPKLGVRAICSLQRHNAAKPSPKTCRLVCVKWLGWHMERGRGNGGKVKRVGAYRRRIHSVAINIPQATATTERPSFNARHAAGNGHRGQAATTTEFANAFISTTCVLNGRKVMTWILQIYPIV